MKRPTLRLTANVFALFIAGLFVHIARSQAPLPAPQASPKASITQTIGITDVTISYHRPGVKGRKIWGGLVPYGQIWRTGANENTTISFGDPVKVEGRDLAAGTYGLHMLPGEKDWTIIFSKNSTSWGSFYYNQSEDALRVTVTPVESPFRERMAFEFDDLTDTSAVASLVWEKLRVPFRISVNTTDLVLAYARNVYLRSSPAFSWQGWSNAAAYCLRNNVNLVEALAWADRSVSMNENVSNLLLKAGLQDKLRKNDDAVKTLAEAASLARTESEMNQVGTRLIARGDFDKAVTMFRKCIEAHPDSWAAYSGLGDGYAKKGDRSNAMENYAKAIGLVKDEVAKKRISDALQKVKEGR